jgi:hypothetical protein
MHGEPIEIRAGELRRLYDYWRAKKGDRNAPRRADIAAAEIKPLMSRIFIVDVLGAPPRFRYRLAGTQLVERFGEEITGRFLDELDLSDAGGEIAAEFRNVAASCRPVCSRWEYTKRDGKLLRYERLLLPLSTDGQTVDMILGCAFAEPYTTKPTAAA